MLNQYNNKLIMVFKTNNKILIKIKININHYNNSNNFKIIPKKKYSVNLLFYLNLIIKTINKTKFSFKLFKQINFKTQILILNKILFKIKPFY